jgi:phenylacetate-coenzyme A ligase PaaK-like adenylate-forming protein
MTSSGTGSPAIVIIRKILDVMNLQERQSRKLLRKNSGSKRKVSNFYRAGTIPSAGDRIVPLMGFLGTSCLGMTGLLPLTSLWVTAL